MGSPEQNRFGTATSDFRYGAQPKVRTKKSLLYFTSDIFIITVTSLDCSVIWFTLSWCKPSLMLPNNIEELKRKVSQNTRKSSITPALKPTESGLRLQPQQIQHLRQSSFLQRPSQTLLLRVWTTQLLRPSQTLVRPAQDSLRTTVPEEWIRWRVWWWV